MASFLYRLKISFILFSSWLEIARACEGPCIEGVTKALIGNYTGVVERSMGTIASDIARELLPKQTAERATTILDPVILLYKENAYNSMETAEFPGFFHGKCQVNGVDPKGCPNPDCPVVCGTPGSIIHFYTTFINIAFNITAQGVANITSPTNSSSQFDQIQKEVMSVCQGQKKRKKRSSRLFYFSEACPNENEIKTTLKKMLDPRNIRNVMQSECGGSSLPNCDWIKQGMKDYVLSWP